MSFRVTNPFQAFHRDYKRDEVLTDSDLACWLPEEDRDIVIEGLVTQGKLERLSVEDPDAKYPPTWGSQA